MNWRQLYAGYLNTPQLWNGTLFEMEQLYLAPIPTTRYSHEPTTKLRLGFLAEHFTFEFWKSHPDVEIICRNIQIEGELQTLGEIDTILKVNDVLKHVEIAYKFYLYDPSHGENEIAHWIGPNRKDTLQAKLDRLIKHQLPLLCKPETKRALSDFIDLSEPIQSQVWLKGQLFVPFGQEIANTLLNPEAIAGHYLNLEQLQKRTPGSYYLPSKLEWISAPHPNVDWQSNEKIINEIRPILEREFSPMLWQKDATGNLSKLFVVWWS